jgi:hypothetical protein
MRKFWGKFLTKILIYDKNLETPSGRDSAGRIGYKRSRPRAMYNVLGPGL